MKNFFFIFVVSLFILFSGLQQSLAASITVTSPNGGESWTQESTHNITWSCQDVDNVKIWLYIGSNPYQSIISTTPCSAGSYSWTIPSTITAGSNYQIAIYQVSSSAIFDTSNGSFSIIAAVTSPSPSTSPSTSPTSSPKICSPGEICNPLSSGSIPDLINKIGEFIYWIAIIIAPLMIIIAGFYFLTAAGDPNRLKTAKNIILWTVIGFAVVMFSKGLISLIKGFLGG